MASLRKTRGGTFIICFRLDGRQFQRTLKTKDSQAAKAVLGRVEHAVYRIANGELTVPEDVDPGEFVVNGRTSPAPPRASAPSPSFAELTAQYLSEQRGQKAESTLGTERIHLSNVQRCLGGQSVVPVRRLTRDDLEAALRQRNSEVEATTVMKERRTLITFFKWVLGREDLNITRSPADGLSKYQENTERARFRTVDEIEQILARGGLTPEEVEALWECLYLDQIQVGEVLAAVKANACHDFIHPMIAIAAYTGMRRGEILRLRWSDVDFQLGLVTAQSKKQSRQTAETSRTIDLHPELASILRDHHGRRPQGQYVICRAESPAPLTVHMAHDHLKRTLQGTAWERPITDERSKVVVGFHMFRHSFASNLAAAGVDQRIIDSMLGHQTEEMRRRYQHLLPSTRRAAVETLSFSVSSTCASSSIG